MTAAERFANYAYDQTAKAVTVYVPYEGAGSLAEEAVKCVFGDRSFELLVTEGSGTRRELKIPNLCQPIDTTRSKLTVKADRLQLKLYKLEPTEWSSLVDDIDRKKRERDARVQHGDLKNASTGELLADMYANATDEERVSLRKAAVDGAMKRAGMTY